jgi:hypothetical protein
MHLSYEDAKHRHLVAAQQAQCSGSAPGHHEQHSNTALDDHLKDSPFMDLRTSFTSLAAVDGT